MKSNIFTRNMSNEENPFSGLRKEIISHADRIEEDQRVQVASIIETAKSILIRDVQTAIREIPPHKIRTRDHIQFSSDAFTSVHQPSNSLIDVLIDINKLLADEGMSIQLLEKNRFKIHWNVDVLTSLGTSGTSHAGYSLSKPNNPLEFMMSPPATFTQELYDRYSVKFVLIFEDHEHLCYLATRDNKDGQINEATTVQIFKSESSETLKSLLRQFKIEVIDPVIINHVAFFSDSLRTAEIEMWAAKALKEFCGFRFF